MNAGIKATGILLMIGLLFHGGVVYGSDQSRQDLSHEKEQDMLRQSVKVEFKASNTDILNDCATSVIVDSENVIAMYIEVYPDGSINCEDFILHPNEDYWISLNYNDVKEVREFHTGENDGHYYILSIDYATGDLAFRMMPEQDLFWAGDYSYYINDNGSVTISGWKGVDKETTIPDKIDGRAVTTIGNWAFSYCKNLTAIRIPDSVTTIGDEAFSRCEGLTAIELPDSVTTIGNLAFRGCTNMTDIKLSNSLTTIGKAAFDGCGNLTGIDLPDSLTAIGDEAFSSCRSLTHVKIPDSVTTIDSSTFFDCRSLSCVELPNSIKTFDCNPFLYCRSLIRIKVSADHETLTVISNVLFNKAENTLICYPEGLSGSEYIVPEGIQKIGRRAFESADQLTDIGIPDSVTTIERGAFMNCGGLESIIIPNSVTMIGENAFEGCSNLESIRIPDSVTEIGNEAFFCCYDLRNVEIPDSVTMIGSKAFGGCHHVSLIVERGSYAEQYAEENEIRYIYADEN